MKNNFLLLLIVVFASCKSVAISKGQYYKEGKDYQYTLNLSEDSSFVLIQKYFEVNSTCKGKWQYLSADTILLKCDSESLYAKLESGYMTERERKVIVLNRNKLKLDKVVLKRK